MDTLPDEIIIQILSFLNTRDITSFQQTCQRYLKPARDSGFWKLRCYDESRFESSRRRFQQLHSQPANLVALREAVTASNVPGLLSATAENTAGSGDGDGSVQKTSGEATRHAERKTAIACWDPSYPNEKVDFYQEYIHRHARTHIDWLDTSSPSNSDTIGLGAMKESDSTVRRLLTAREDGSVQIWNVAAYGGRLLSTSAPGTLTTSVAYKDRETGAVENVTIDSQQNKAYIAISDELHEIDLNTLQASQKRAFPFPITVLSEATHPLPITVGTNNTLHLYDPRVSYVEPADNSTRLELLNGTTLATTSSTFLPGVANPTAHVTLQQPGPTSIVHPFSTSSADFTNPIYIAGRFTSILAYDRRTWPRITGTIFSGARLSSMAVLPYPYVPYGNSLPPSTTFIAKLDMLKSSPGCTLIAGGVYGGKGSLEMYGISSSPPVRDTFRAHPSDGNCRRNRQTASRSRLISVASHGTSIVFSDGDGNVKWVERNGSTVIREACVVVPPAGPRPQSRRPASSLAPSSADSSRQQTREEYDDAEPQVEATDDILQKLLPVRLASHTSSQPDDLLLYSSSGRIGIMGFGRRTLTNTVNPDYSSGKSRRLSTLSEEEYHDAMTPEELAEQEEERSKEAEERKFSRMMRKALERQAEEVRWMQDLGVSYGL